MPKIFVGVLSCLLGLVPFQAQSPRWFQSAPSQRPSFLATEVGGFDNKGKSLVPTLLLIAGTYHVPMGIEQATPDSLERPIFVRLTHGTVADLLASCTVQLSGYAWTLQDGVVDVHGPNEWADPTNLFNLKVANFKVVDSTLNDANNRLRDLVFSASGIAGVESPKQGPVGIGGDSPGNLNLERKHVTIAMENTTVRAILNKIVVLSPSAGQPVVWVANVPPDKLAQAPGNGLWRLVPVGDPAAKQP